MTVTPHYPIDYDSDLDITPIQKQNWKTGESRDYWSDALNTCKDQLPYVELESVCSDETERDVAIIDITTVDTVDFYNTVSRLSLVIDKDTTSNHVAVGTDRDIARQAITALKEGDHRTVGELCGYPKCCIDAYESYYNGKRFHAPIYEMACDTACATEHDGPESIIVEDADGMLNTLWQYYGWSFLSHTPCSFDCEESREIAITHGKLFRELGYGDEAEKLFEFLSTPTTWDGYHGLSRIRNGYCIGSTNTQNYWSKKEVVWVEPHETKLL